MWMTLMLLDDCRQARAMWKRRRCGSNINIAWLGFHCDAVVLLKDMSWHDLRDS